MNLTDDRKICLVDDMDIHLIDQSKDLALWHTRSILRNLLTRERKTDEDAHLKEYVITVTAERGLGDTIPFKAETRAGVDVHRVVVSR